MAMKMSDIELSNGGAAPRKGEKMEDKGNEEQKQLTEEEMHRLLKEYDKPNEEGLCDFPTDIVFVLKEQNNG